MGAKKPTKIWSAVIIFLALNSPVIYGQQGATVVKPLDVILLIDNSPSTKSTDPKNLRISAACFLIDYLTKCSEMQEINYRVGVMNFGGELSSIHSQLRPLQDGKARENLQAEIIQLTDFRPALDWAYKELFRHSWGTGNKMAVLLFTDGSPQFSESPLSYKEKQKYFSGKKLKDDPYPSFNIKKMAENLHTLDAALFVVAVGDAPLDADLWVTTGQDDEGLIPLDHYRSIDATTNLNDVYHKFFSEFIGLMATSAQLITAKQSFKIDLTPCLEHVIFTFIKSDRNVKITLMDSTGQNYQQSWENDEYNHELFAIPDPKGGEWDIQVSSNKAWMWVDMQLPELIIHDDLPETLKVGQTVTFSASLQRHLRPIVDPHLNLEAHLSGPAIKETRKEKMKSSIKNDKYELIVKGFNKPGEYLIQINATYNGQAVNALNGQKKIYVASPTGFAGLIYSAKKLLWNWQSLPLLALFLAGLVFLGFHLYFNKPLDAINNYKSGQYFALALERAFNRTFFLKKWGFDTAARAQKIDLAFEAFPGHITNDDLEDPVFKKRFSNILDIAASKNHDIWWEYLQRYIKHQQPELKSIAREDFRNRALSPDGLGGVKLLSKAARDGLIFDLWKKS